MSDPDFRLLSDGQSLVNLEDAICAAREYIHPTDDLRPRIIERAREQDADKRAWRRLRVAILIMSLVILVVAPAVYRRGWIHRPAVGPSGQELHALSMKLADESGMTLDWAILEAFSQWRLSLAFRFDRAAKNLR